MADGEDKLEALQRQVQELQRALAEERSRRQNLEHELKQSPRRSTPSRSMPTASQNGHKPGTNAPTTPRSRTPTKASTSRTPLASAASPKSPATPRGTAKDRSSTPNGGTGSSRPAPRTASSARSNPTVLQHVWDKFCAAASSDLSPMELGLVSKETLVRLIAHYGFRSPIHKAQIEAQWALLQEGKETVGADATPKEVEKQRKKLLSYPAHSEDFAVPVEEKKPRLSNRVALGMEATKPSNPNDTGSVSTTPRNLTRYDNTTPSRARVPSNPNATPTVDRTATPSKAMVTSPARTTTPTRCHTRQHVSGPPSGKEASPKLGKAPTEAPRSTEAPVTPRPTRRMYSEQERTPASPTPRRGVKVFERRESPGPSFRPCIRMNNEAKATSITTLSLSERHPSN